MKDFDIYGVNGNRRKHFRDKYKLTSEQFIEMLEKQTDACAICREPFDHTRKPVIDHDHRSGKVRALLCDNCNVGIGRFYDRPELVLRAYRFLAQWYGLNKPLDIP